MYLYIRVRQLIVRKIDQLSLYLKRFYIHLKTAFLPLSNLACCSYRQRAVLAFLLGRQCVTWQPAARSAVHLQREEEEEQWSLDALVELGRHFSLEFSLSSPTKFYRRSRGIAGSGMELSIARFCCMLLSLLAGKFSDTKPLRYFDSNLLLKRQLVLSPVSRLPQRKRLPLAITWKLAFSDKLYILITLAYVFITSR